MGAEFVLKDVNPSGFGQPQDATPEKAQPPQKTAAKGPTKKVIATWRFKCSRGKPSSTRSAKSAAANEPPDGSSSSTSAQSAQAQPAAQAQSAQAQPTAQAQPAPTTAQQATAATAQQAAVQQFLQGVQLDVLDPDLAADLAGIFVRTSYADLLFTHCRNHRQ